jgi:hypothetical protein
MIAACAEKNIPFEPPGIKQGVDQMNGQLMGSPLSFPYLCLINFIVSWEAVYPYLLDFRHVPIRVNGDDILFRCPASRYAFWRDSVKDAGFQLSIGKNFFHPRYLFINSQPWSYTDRGDGEPEFKYIPFFNQGLMSGQSKVGKVSGRPFADSLAPTYSLHREAIAGATNTEAALASFFHRNREHLDEISDKGFFSFHAPVEYGGLGMWEGKRDVLTHTQRRIAYVCQTNAIAGIVLRRPQCLDDKQKPYFSHAPVHGPIQLDRGAVRKKSVRELKSPSMLSPFVTEMGADDVGFDRESRVCTAREVTRYYRKRLRLSAPPVPAKT